ncbi:hypothetical protein FGG65_gp35 [Corynebacterium phage phi673]|uniref:Uncharacterized protein n=1 Tax=Corynebacterium phage phi673 TaxID=2052821 RepID=A0A2H4PIU2_9CAUD|nr:hypothetical protein FGG65_gp35 [Corynebacterium phage phi673]ATW62897.1 hypothetical protein phi673_gp35 [Corynebacterium phage phi673]
MSDSTATIITTPIARDILPIATYSTQGEDSKLYTDLFQIAVIQSGIRDLAILASDCIQGKDDSICVLQSTDWLQNARMGEYAITIDDNGSDLHLEWLAGRGVGAYVNAVNVIGNEYVEAIIKVYNER